MVTIRKLAALAGVSHVSVWLALHNRPGLSPQVRARILALADEYHYHPNRLAEGWLSGKTRTVGLIIEHVTWYFYAQLCDGVMSAAMRDEAHVIILNAMTGRGDASQLPPLIAHLIDQRVDGIILAAGETLVPAKSVLEMWSHDIVPVLIGDTHAERALDHIDTDERRLAQLTLDYLLQQGHQRIAYCGLERRRARNQEMQRAFDTRGLSLELFCHDAGCLVSPAPQYVEHYLDLFLHQPHPPSAIICYNDHMAIQLLQHAQRRGVRVPEDLSIVGCGNDVVCGFLTPALTSLEQHPGELGTRAYELLQRRRSEETAPGERLPESMLISPELVIRDSCAPPARVNAACRSNPAAVNSGLL